ncbi:hypothetical protein G7046_g2681 [Stylonectria norvegica]|nr:hypothetical protein G7046_g2681 [Stylonectria norvegica]
MAELRSACDRCHDKKLRCVKLPQFLVCGRCVKANVACVFSPPTRSLRNGLQDVGFDWPPLMTFDQTPDGFLITPPVSDSYQPETVSPSSSEVSQLADVMVTLDRIYREFPSGQLLHLPEDHLKEFTERMAANYDLQSALETLLQQAQQLTLLYPAILKLAAHGLEEPLLNDACTIPGCMHRVRETFKTSPKPKLDYALLHLLVASHLRLLDIVDNLIDHSRFCARMVTKLPEGQEPQFDIPPIRIGSFVAQKGSAASMLISMLIELQASLKAKSKALSVMVSSSGDASSRVSRALEMQGEDLCDRCEQTMAELHTLRGHLMRVGLMA